MRYEVKQRVFYRGRVKNKFSLSVPPLMGEPLEKLASSLGYTVPELISIVLDQYLVQEAREGRIHWPPDFDPSMLEEPSKPSDED